MLVRSRFPEYVRGEQLADSFKADCEVPCASFPDNHADGILLPFVLVRSFVTQTLFGQLQAYGFAIDCEVTIASIPDRSEAGIGCCLWLSGHLCLSA